MRFVSLCLVITLFFSTNTLAFGADPYLLLGLVNDRNISDELVNKAFISAAKELEHQNPPLSETDYELRLNELMDAYNSISTSEKRQKLKNGESISSVFDLYPLLVKESPLEALKIAEQEHNPPIEGDLELLLPKKPPVSPDSRYLSFQRGATRFQCLVACFDVDGYNENLVVPVQGDFWAFWQTLRPKQQDAILGSISGRKLEHAVLAIIAGMNPTNQDARAEFLNLMLRRFNGSTLAFSNFMYSFVPNISFYLDSTYYLSREQFKAIYPGYIAASSKVSISTIDFAVRTLLDVNDFFTIRTVADFMVQAHGILPSEDFADGVFRALDRSNTRLKSASGLWMAFRSSTWPVRIAYRMTCGLALHGSYKWRRAPF